ncbi:hypothetical protein PhCBS80983_g01717 [Powellomyces hirtus]|uniref:C2H2-type domain-containing protein n=1 Tax=Powellomyces hirtus TaxID=109895 RepID=A0A507EC43_9FUNG|nr:hypothetical protein PhCBS80983_g01717 [Powellomyces hirtus]
MESTSSPSELNANAPTRQEAAAEGTTSRGDSLPAAAPAAGAAGVVRETGNNDKRAAGTPTNTITPFLQALLHPLPVDNAKLLRRKSILEDLQGVVDDSRVVLPPNTPALPQQQQARLPGPPLTEYLLSSPETQGRSLPHLPPLSHYQHHHPNEYPPLSRSPSSRQHSPQSQSASRLKPFGPPPSLHLQQRLHHAPHDSPLPAAYQQRPHPYDGADLRFVPPLNHAGGGRQMQHIPYGWREQLEDIVQRLPSSDVRHLLLMSALTHHDVREAVIMLVAPPPPAQPPTMYSTGILPSVDRSAVDRNAAGSPLLPSLATLSPAAEPPSVSIRPSSVQVQPPPSTQPHHSPHLGQPHPSSSESREHSPSMSSSSSSNRPFRCNRCTAAFNRRHDLSRHVRIHEGIRPYFCPQCGRGFSRQDALARHHANSRGCNAARRDSITDG